MVRMNSVLCRRISMYKRANYYYYYYVYNVMSSMRRTYTAPLCASQIRPTNFSAYESHKT
jgi:hypothetical protein